MTTVRALPLATAPVPGEALDSWLQATAVRHGIALTDLYQHLGLDTIRDLRDCISTVAVTNDTAQRISAATGVTPTQIQAMTLARYLPAVTRRPDAAPTFTAVTPGHHGDGWRFCPHCLAASGEHGCCGGACCGVSPACSITACSRSAAHDAADDNGRRNLSTRCRRAPFTVPTRIQRPRGDADRAATPTWPTPPSLPCRLPTPQCLPNASWTVCSLVNWAFSGSTPTIPPQCPTSWGYPPSRTRHPFGHQRLLPRRPVVTGRPRHTIPKAVATQHRCRRNGRHRHIGDRKCGRSDRRDHAAR